MQSGVAARLSKQALASTYTSAHPPTYCGPPPLALLQAVMCIGSMTAAAFQIKKGDVGRAVDSAQRGYEKGKEVYNDVKEFLAPVPDPPVRSMLSTLDSQHALPAVA